MGEFLYFNLFLNHNWIVKKLREDNLQYLNSDSFIKLEFKFKKEIVFRIVKCLQYTIIFIFSNK